MYISNWKPNFRLILCYNACVDVVLNRVRLFSPQNLPALVLKIMQASAALQPIDPTYSSSLNDLIYVLLQRNPDDRPDVSRIMATPVLVNAHTNLATDVGRLPCTK
jgi:serine/threonine protein kinase